MKPSRHPRRTAYCAAWSSTTPQSIQAGSTWSRSRSACCAASASTAASARATASSPKLPPGNSSATPPAPASPGCSPPSALAPKWPALTPTLPKCHNPCAEVLGEREAMIDPRLALFGVGSLLFGALIVAQAMPGGEKGPTIAPAVAHWDGERSRQPNIPPPIDPLVATILGRPLFSPDRRPPE